MQYNRNSTGAHRVQMKGGTHDVYSSRSYYGITTDYTYDKRGYNMSKLDYFFSDYKWYRRIIGGTWYFIRLNVGIDCVFFWSRSDLKCSKRYIVKTEEY